MSPAVPPSPRLAVPDARLTAELLGPLNPEQRVAVLHETGPLLVLAGAGSGKTRVIAHRIALLIRGRGVDPAGICALTFTNRAARELAERVGRLVGGATRELTTGTFHSFAARLLRGLAPGIGRTPGYVIYDDDDQLRVLRPLAAELAIPSSLATPEKLRSWLDRVKSDGRQLATARPPRGLGEDQARQLGQRYEEELRRADALDFGDLIAKLVELLEAEPGIAAQLRWRYRYLLVDEYQDTSPIQDRLVEALAGPEGNLTVVGDDDQAIYGWRGASAANILTFPERHPGCQVVRLERNYRSCPPILEAANAVIQRSAERLGKTLRPVREGGEPVTILGFADDRAEAEGVAAVVQAEVAAGRRLGDFAVLYRTASLSRRLEEAFARAGLAHAVLGGVRFYERAEVKDLLAWARFLLNPQDGVAARRALTSPRRGIGATTLAKLAAWVQQTGESWLAAAAAAAGPKSKPARGLAEVVELVRELAGDAATLAPSLALERILLRTGLQQQIAASDELEARERFGNLRELLLAAAELEGREPDARLATFLELSALATDADATLPEDRISLLTLHAAKGLEFPVAILVGLEEGTFPMDREDTDVQEERRLCYVGMTRARDRLILTWARVRCRFDDVRVCDPSRFLGELPASACARRVTPLDLAEPAGVGGRRAGRPAPPVREVPDDPFPDYESGDAGWDEEGCGLLPGDTVRHATLGDGEVVAVTGHGPATFVSVRFPFRGVKRVKPGYLSRLA
ncbi:MAG: UvrD-helicase domain-containing protein [Myxococcota bacterium]|nr:UvrD-helicase domain-containing protein [Myxococcota bacterium]